MNEFLPRTGPVASLASATERGPAVRVIPVVEATRSSTEAEAAYKPSVTQRSTGAADYARIQASIADILSRIKTAPASSSETVISAEKAIVALMPSPVIVLPLPPADPQIVAFVAQVAQSMAERSAQARVAQASATPIMVEAAAN